ncbi:p450 domain containing protein, partial [Asbolus verrucosus]
LTVAYYWLKSNYEYWKKRGIPGPKPRFFVGNLGQSFIMKKSPSHIYTDIYEAYQNASMVGIFRACTPVLLLRDPELIKDVTIKLFRNFHDNDIDVDKKADPLIGRNPFFLKGEEWKMVRAQLTPGFTSGKMKWLYAHLEETSLQLVKFIENQRGTMNGDGYEAKELCSRFTLNNVASCAFGIEGKCFEEENSEFRQIAKKFLSPGTWATILFFCVTLFPSISKIVSIRLIPKDIERKLNNIVSQTLKYREKNDIVRNDFLHILAQLKKTCKDYEFTDVDVTAHAAGFFGDGYETSSIVMSFALFALAASPEAQSKLREEVVKNFAENNDKIPYEALQAMSYLDGVVNETLRIYPPLFSLQKICTSSHTFTQENEK